MRRLLSSAVGLALAAGALTVAAPGAGAATSRVSTRTLLNGLVVAAEHHGGYTSSAFGSWIDADHDGCVTRKEVLLRDATTAPHVGGDCTLTGGRWWSRYDARRVSKPSAMTADHLVPTQEVWQSTGWRWDRDTRRRFTNDLGDPRTLIAVTGSAAKAKAGREVTAWLPPNTAFDCTYVARWVAVKWRWRLSVDSTERSFLARHLSACGWPSVPTPKRAKVVYATAVFSFVGDTILGDTPELPDDPGAYLSPVVGQLRNGVDVGFANLEGTLTRSTQAKCSGGSSCFTFRNPPSYGHVFARAGYDVLNLANNHSHDFGATGLSDTKDAIRAAGMHHTGLPGEITYVMSHGIRIGFVGFAPYSSTNNLLDLSTAASLIRRAHAHSTIVVVYMHAGAEGADAAHVTGKEEHYVGEDRGNPRRFAHMAIDNGASIVVASGPHVMRGMEFYRHRLVAYSLGNFASYHNFNTSGVLSHSAVLRVTLTRTGGFQTGRLVSVTLASSGHATVGGGSVSFVRSLSTSDFGAAAAKLSKSGAVTPP